MTPSAPGTRPVSDVACLGCGCLCDDLRVDRDPDTGQVVAIDPECSLGLAWFREASAPHDHPLATLDGSPAEASLALDRAADLLRSARAPWIWGLTRSTTEAVRAALALADRARASVVLDRPADSLARLSAFQQEGRVTATLGEVKARADVVVFWGVDPLRTHPRHLERYSAHPRGRFLPEGRAGRHLIVVDQAPGATAAIADDFLAIAPDADLAALTRLRLLIQKPETPTDGLSRLASRLLGARYATIFFQGRSNRPTADWEAVTRLVRDLNDHNRAVLLTLGAAGNLAGAEAALAWQAGYPQGVDYRLGYPMPLQENEKPDLLLAVADRLPDDTPSGIPVIHIGPHATGHSTRPATVAIATTTAGIDAAGSVVRNDGVCLPLRPVRGSDLPDQAAILVALHARLAPGLAESRRA